MGLSRFKFEVVYKKGEKNIADYISRHPVGEKGREISAVVTRQRAQTEGRRVPALKETVQELERIEVERERKERVERKRAKRRAVRSQPEKKGERKEDVGPTEARAGPWCR